MRNLFPLVLLTTLLCALGSHRTEAQYYYLPYPSAGQNPGGLNTDPELAQGNGLAPGWTTVLNGDSIAGPAVWSAVQAVPFPFVFNGHPVTQYLVSGTGVLTFSVAGPGPAPAVTNVALPTSPMPDESVCVWGLKVTPANDSTNSSGDYVVTKTFGTAPHRQYWVMFNSCFDADNDTFAYWSIVLEETTNCIYVVDQRTGGPSSLTVGLQLSATQAVQVAASPNVTGTDRGSGLPADNGYYQFIPGQQPAYDLAALTLSLRRYEGLTNGPVPLTGTLRNLGAQTITSFDLNYSVDGGASVSQPVVGQSIAPLAVATFTAPQGWQPASRGPHTLRVWMSNLNGQPDQQPANDTTRKSTLIADTIVARRVLLESFTSSTCDPCLPGNINVRNVLAASPGQAVRIAYQQKIPPPPTGTTDPYYTAEGGARFHYYNGQFVPLVMLDGGWRGNSQALNGPTLQRFYDVPAIFSVEAYYTVIGQTVMVVARLTPHYDFLTTPLAVHTIITEKHTQNNVRTNGETDFFDVMKKMMPDEHGTPLPLTVSGQPALVTMPYTFPAQNTVEHFDSLQVVVFVQDTATREVFNATSARRMAPAGLSALATDHSLTLAPNPAASGMTEMQFVLAAPQVVAVEVLDALGRVVLTRPAAPLAAGPHALPLELRGARPGLYLVRLLTDTTTLTQRLVVE